MRSFLLFCLLLSSIISFSQDRLVFLTDSDSTLIVDHKTLHMQSPSGSLFVGKNAGANEGLEFGNTSIGNSAGFFNNEGNYNTMLGHNAGFGNVSGSQNTYLGFATGENAINGDENISIGAFANRTNAGNQNVVIGTSAATLTQDLTGIVAIGYQAGFNNQGIRTTLVGYQSGLSNNAAENLTAIGYSSGYSNTTGINNTFLGTNSGFSNSTAGGNTFLGSYAGWQNTGPENTFVGVSAGANNTGDKNIVIGYTAGLFSKGGSENVFIGHNSGRNNDGGSNNVFLGLDSGLNNDEGKENIAIGTGALKNEAVTGITSDPDFSVAVGYEAGKKSYGDGNTFLGFFSGAANSGGGANTFIGRNSGADSQGSFNTFVGSFAGLSNQGGGANTYLGYNAGRYVSNRSGNVYLGQNVQGAGLSNELAIDNGNTSTPLISGRFEKDFLTFNGIVRVSESAGQSFVTEGAGLYFYHDKANRIGVIESLDYSIPQQTQGELLLRPPTSVGFQVNAPNYYFKLPTNIRVGDAIARSWDTYSDARIKSNVHGLEYGLASIMLLNPVSYFQHDTDTNSSKVRTLEEGEATIGLIAQEVYRVIPEAVHKPKDESTALWTMDYEKVIPVLIKAIQELQAEIEELKKEKGKLADVK